MTIPQNFNIELIPIKALDIPMDIRAQLAVYNKYHMLLISADTIMLDVGLDKSPELFEYIKANHIPCTMYRNKGGTIILTPDDLSIMVLFPNGADEDTVIPFLKKQLSSFIYKYAGNHVVSEDNNDILIDGYKVSSFAYNPTGYVQLFNFNVSDKDLVGIPLKDRVKSPKGLTALIGKTKDDLLAELNSIFVDKQYV
ncbi:MAG: hypothetical protein RR365_00905 [Bacteroides sp.]